MDPKRRPQEFDDTLDDDERDIHESLVKGDYVPVPDQAKQLQELQRAARNTLRKKPITLRVQETDISRLKVKAIEQGIPYQTLISSIIHQYATGRLVPKR